MKLELSIDASLHADLKAVAEHFGVAEIGAMAVIAVTQWVAARKAELDNRDPDQRYFVNEALDDLLDRQKKSD